MELYFFIGLMTVFVPILCAFETNGVEYNINYHETPRTAIKLKCDKGFQLADIEMLGGASIFNDDCDEDVYGKTPALIKAVNKCHWKRSCTITIPKDIMVTCYAPQVDRNTTIFRQIQDFIICSCVWREVEFLQPVRAVCMKMKDIHTIWKHQQESGNKCYEITNQQRLRDINMEGLIRSHQNIPWFYKPSLRKKSYCLKLHVPVKKKLVIGVKFVDLCDIDSLKLIAKHRTIELTEKKISKHYIFRRKDKYVKIRFSTGEDTPGCGGFALCYKATEENNKKVYDGLHRHVCDDLYIEARRYTWERTS